MKIIWLFSILALPMLISSCGPITKVTPPVSGTTPVMKNPHPMACEQLSSSNCLTQAFTNLASCLPTTDPSGILDSTLSRCAFAGNTFAQFNNSARGLDFSIQNGLNACANVKMDNLSYTITYKNQTTYLIFNTYNDTADLICPDGTSFTLDSKTIQKCPQFLPSIQYSRTLTKLNFSIGIGSTGNLMSCSN